MVVGLWVGGLLWLSKDCKWRESGEGSSRSISKVWFGGGGGGGLEIHISEPLDWSRHGASKLVSPRGSV